MSRAADQRKVVKYALLRGRLVPKSLVIGGEEGAVEHPAAPSEPAFAELPEVVTEVDVQDEDEAVEAESTEDQPKRRGRPPKVREDHDLSAFEA